MMDHINAVSVAPTVHLNLRSILVTILFYTYLLLKLDPEDPISYSYRKEKGRQSGLIARYGPVKPSRQLHIG